MPNAPKADPVIARCLDYKGEFVVTFRSLVQDPETLDHVDGPSSKLELPSHPWTAESREGSPILDTAKPYTGSLCVHEWEFLKGMPGKDFNYGWRFVIEALK